MLDAMLRVLLSSALLASAFWLWKDMGDAQHHPSHLDMPFVFALPTAKVPHIPEAAAAWNRLMQRRDRINRHHTFDVSEHHDWRRRQNWHVAPETNPLATRYQTHRP